MCVCARVRACLSPWSWCKMFQWNFSNDANLEKFNWGYTMRKDRGAWDKCLVLRPFGHLCVRLVVRRSSSHPRQYWFWAVAIAGLNSLSCSAASSASCTISNQRLQSTKNYTLKLQCCKLQECPDETNLIPRCTLERKRVEPRPICAHRCL